MDSAWDLEAGPESFRQQSWFIRLGRGAVLRAMNLPLILTRKMEHHVRRAPDHYTVLQALRYGETRGLGGSEVLAREVALGRLGQRIEHPDFWRTILHFFVAHPDMERAHVNPIIDFRHRDTTIWSLRLRANDQEKRMATIEVDPRRRAIIQVRAQCNRRPGVRSLEIIHQWAAREGLLV